MHFDNLARIAFRTTSNLIGYEAQWVPFSFPEQSYLVKGVHFKDPNAEGYEKEMDKVDYRERQPFMQYYEGDFPGLLESVTSSRNEERVEIKFPTGEVRTFEIVDVNRIFDGRTYRAMLREL